MRRRLFAVASAISLLLFVGTVVLWVRSYAACDQLILYTRRSRIDLVSGLGILACSRTADLSHELVIPDSGWVYISNDPAPNRAWICPIPLVWGFGYYVNRVKGVADPWRALSVPYWAMALGSLIMPAAWLILSYRRWSCNRANHCPKCGYSLTGNTSGVCPECGTPVPQHGNSSGSNTMATSES
ncbi:MAG TPA: hypothetical protein VK797_05005 [Tepidisphaeraceae bacterium]|jgi:hypothetical protein|nr:hypothetical protein [Tepidisphaeraceae bacterium]